LYAFLPRWNSLGVKREDVEMGLVGRRLTIHGEQKERERVGILRGRTRRVGQFQYEVVLPREVADDEVEARVADGVLTVRVPKAVKAKPRRIKVVRARGELLDTTRSGDEDAGSDRSGLSTLRARSLLDGAHKTPQRALPSL
jgi:Hsp20/alpha crystallin family